MGDEDYQSMFQMNVDLGTIPKIFHSVWLGGAFPREYREFRASWCRHNPDWELMCWSDENLPELRLKHEYEAMSTYAGKADIVRLELLANLGGVYVDADFECCKSIEPICSGRSLWLSEVNGRIENGIIGSVPAHSFIEALIQAIPDSVASQPGESCLVTTGPVLLTRVYNERCRAGLPVPVVLPREWFFPYSGEERHRRYETFPDAYAVHHWGGSWLPTYASPKEKIRRVLMKSAATRRLLYAYHRLKRKWSTQ